MNARAGRGDAHAWRLRERLRARAARRHRRRLLVLAASAAAALALPTIWNAPVLLLWNATSSAPIGLYAIQHGAEARVGDMVAAFAPEPYRSLAARRAYVPADVPLVKLVAAVSGDRICASGKHILVARHVAAIRLRADSRGRALPWWNGCRRLGKGQVLLLSDNPLSFDGRYFGPVKREALVGKAKLLWQW